MIAGIGHDMVDLRRLGKMAQRHPQRLPQRLLTVEEQREYADCQFALSYLAGRIAAKEALAKALGCGLRAPMFWRRVSVLANANGAPFLDFAAPLAAHLRQQNIVACHVSITHDGDYAAAAVVAERL